MLYYFGVVPDDGTLRI